MTNCISIPEELAGERIDTALRKLFPEYSRTYFQYLIDTHSVRVNCEEVKKRHKLKAKDELEVFFQPHQEISLTPEEIPLEILFEDDHIIAINKPAHMVVHPGPGHPSGTFVHALLFHCNNLPGEKHRPGIVHRLDKETSGVLIAAKTHEAHQALVEHFAKRKMRKEYLAITLGRPPKALIEEPIARHPIQRKQMTTSSEGKSAKTTLEVVAIKDNLSLVRAHPHTGRTHQIRVHLKHIQTPLLGDSIYGIDRVNQREKTSRHHLHAHRLHFDHPLTQEPLTITAPIPEDFLLEKYFPGLEGAL